MDSSVDRQLGDLLLQSGAGHYIQHLLIDLAGDLVTGTLLSQIIYWFRPDKDGHTKLRIEREDRLWLAKTRADWWDECRISRKQFIRSISILKDKGLVETRVWKFRGFPTVHIWLNLSAIVVGVQTIVPKGNEPMSPKGTNDSAQREQTLPTETTYRDYPTETTSIPSGFVPSTLEEALFKLPYWKPQPEADRIWLAEFSIEFPDLTLAHVIACRDHWDGKRVSHKGQWKSRLRNWMRIDKERKDQGYGRRTPTHRGATTPSTDELARSWK